VPEKDAAEACRILGAHGAQATVIGRAVAAPGKTVGLPQRHLLGTESSFTPTR
jgi:hypothetical protein